MDIRKILTETEAKADKLIDDCYKAGKYYDGKAEKLLISTVHDLTQLVKSLVAVHKETIQEEAPVKKSASTKKQVLMEDSKDSKETKDKK